MKRIIQIIFFSYLMWGCADFPTDVTVPIWDTEARLPITQQEYRLGDIINLDEEVRIDSTLDPYIYRITSQTYQRTVYVGDYADGLIDEQYVVRDVPVGTLDTSAIYKIAGNNLINSANITDGIIRITYQNPSSEPMNVTVTIPALTKDGVVFSISGPAPAFGQLDESRSIAGYVYDPTGISNPDELYLELDASGNLSPETSDLFINISNTRFSYVDGTLEPRELGNVNEEIDFEIPEDTEELRNKVVFHDARMYLNINYDSPNQNPFSASLISPVIVGIYESNQILLTQKDGSQLNDIVLIDGEYYFVYDTENSNLSEFLAFMPQRVFVRGTTLLNPSEERGEVSDIDELDIDLYIEVGSVMSINQAGFTENEDIKFTDDDRENLERAKRIMLYYELENEVPILTNIDLEFLGQSNNLLFSKTLELGTGEAEFGNDFVKKIYRDSVLIDENEMDSFRNSYSTRFKVEISTNSENDKPFFSPDQIISIKTWADITVEVDLDEEDEEEAQ